MKKYIIFLLLITTIILASCWKNTNSTLNTSSNSNNKWAKVSKEECMNGCYMMWKSNASNKDKTESDMNKDCEDLCNASQWMENNDLSSCEKTSDPLLKNWCYSEIAKDKWDETICDKISDKLLKDTCIVWVAEKLKDKSLCDKISESFMKTSCIDNLKEE